LLAGDAVVTKVFVSWRRRRRLHRLTAPPLGRLVGRETVHPHPTRLSPLPLGADSPGTKREGRPGWNATRCASGCGWSGVDAVCGLVPWETGRLQGRDAPIV